MQLSEAWRINTPGVIGEVIDDEAIIVNLDTGAYYSLNGSGSEIWSLLQQQSSIRALVESLKKLHSGRTTSIERVVLEFLGSLEAEGLICLADETAPHTLPPVTASAGQPFTKPAFTKYTDMAELLLLDPIHDVDEEGWPHAAIRPQNKTDSR